MNTLDASLIMCEIIVDVLVNAAFVTKLHGDRPQTYATHELTVSEIGLLLVSIHFNEL